MKITAFISVILAMLVSKPLLAHPGHDHNAMDVGLVHLLWLVPVIVGAVVIVFKEITSPKG